jgi:hypothetical protein
MIHHTRVKFLLAALAIICLAVTVSYSARASDDDDTIVLKARLTGFQEVTPKFTTGRGSFSAKLSPDGKSLTFTLTWSGLTGPPLFAHIHFGQPAVNGGIMVFLCGPTGPTNPNKPACTQATSGTATGTITAADVFNPNPDQGVNNGDFAGLLQIIRSGDTYANIHTTRFPGGEIRGLIRVFEEEDHDH